MYKIKLADGTELDNLTLNGNNFISENIIDDDVFSSDNLTKVIISDENGSTEYRNMKLVQNKVHGSQSWFILVEKTKEELEKEESEIALATLSYEVVNKDLIIQQLQDNQANLMYELMTKGVI